MFVLKNCGFCSRKFFTRTGFELHLSVQHGFKTAIRVHRNLALVEELKTVTADDVTQWSSDDEGSVTVWPEKRRSYQGDTREALDLALETFSVTQQSHRVSGVSQKVHLKNKKMRSLSRPTHHSITVVTEAVKQPRQDHTPSFDDVTHQTKNLSPPAAGVTQPTEINTGVTEDDKKIKSDDSVTQQDYISRHQPKRKSEPASYADLCASSSDADDDSDASLGASENNITSDSESGLQRSRRSVTLKSRRGIKQRSKGYDSLHAEKSVTQESDESITAKSKRRVSRHSDVGVTLQAEKNVTRHSDKSGEKKRPERGITLLPDKSVTHLPERSDIQSRSEKNLSQLLKESVTEKTEESKSEGGITTRPEKSATRKSSKDVTHQSKGTTKHRVTLKTEQGCHKCGKKFLNREYRLHHFRKGNECPNVCGACDLAFQSFRELNLHKFSVHDKKKVHSCEICGQQFTSALGRRQHIQVIHEGSKPIRCKLCDKSFGQKANLYIHMKGFFHRNKAATLKNIQESITSGW